ncbi:unnamed protein product [Lactuca virosa]|uniref:Uncharacterized protein n=1 Tax=Lactuca virosa TaxID=75947 RepID=A0AAU9LSE3_9ASTR|nr:unnamed protein product [Lactuca virosa]
MTSNQEPDESDERIQSQLLGLRSQVSISSFGYHDNNPNLNRRCLEVLQEVLLLEHWHPCSKSVLGRNTHLFIL